MTDTLLPIGKMAQINHISIPTLRLYDKMGLLKPTVINEETGYRYYDIRQNARLDMIAYMKELGMSLAEIKDILEKEDITLIEEILVQKNEQLHRQMAELKNRHDAVERVITGIERYRKSPGTGTISLEYIDQRYTWGIPCSENFYEKDISSFEMVLSELRDALISREFPQIHTYNIGTTITREDFINGRFTAGDVFIFSDRHLYDVQKDSRIVESGMYACIYSDDYDREPEYAEQLLEFCRERDYTISGDYICEVMTEFNFFDIGKRSMFMRLQVPVSFLN